jgi:hypothetical protein
MQLDVCASFATPAQLYDRAPNAFGDATSSPATEVMMGDIVETNDDSLTLHVEVATHIPDRTGGNPQRLRDAAYSARIRRR